MKYKKDSNNQKDTKKILVVIETQKVKSYLFSSPFLRETRGASLILDRLNRKESKKLISKFKGETVYLGGGSGRVLFDSRSNAEEFKNSLLELYREQTINARIAVEIVERKNNESFPEAVRRGVELCHQSKFSRFEGKTPIGGRWIRPCTSCGQEQAESIWHEFGEHRLCRSCYLKRQEINRLYANIRPGRTELQRPLASETVLKARYSDDFIFTTLSEYIETEVFLPQDFDDIGGCSSPVNYMGFIYSDGDRMGETVQKLGKHFLNGREAKEAYTAFSKITDMATRHAAVEAVLSVVGLQKKTINGKESFYLPAEFIMAGGDDLMLVVPAHYALDVAIRYMELFQEKTKLKAHDFDGISLHKILPEGLTSSAGVVISHRQFPASELMTLAGDLMKIAKRKASKLAKQRIIIGALDFMVLSDSSSAPIKERRKLEYIQKTPSGKTVHLTERPYTLEGCKELLNAIRNFKKTKVPATKLKALYPVIFKDTTIAQYEALIIKKRLRKTGVLSPESPLAEFFNELNVFPYRERKESWSTPLSELIEFYDYIRG